jgi:hypothetical protein
MRETILEKDDDTILVRTDGHGTYVETSTGNRNYGSDRHDEIVDDYLKIGWVIKGQ